MGAQRPDNSRLIGVIEDDPAVLHSLEFSLRAEGYGVCAFVDGADAGDSLEILQADCLVIDYALADGTGVDLLRALRQRGMTCPAIVIASNPTMLCRHEAGAAGAPLVEKPLMGDVLNGYIREALALAAGARLRV